MRASAPPVKVERVFARPRRLVLGQEPCAPAASIWEDDEWEWLSPTSLA